MTNDESNTPPLDKEAQERSAEERNIVAPTPRDVRAKAEEHAKNGRKDSEPPAEESPTS